VHSAQYRDALHNIALYKFLILFYSNVNDVMVLFITGHYGNYHYGNWLAGAGGDDVHGDDGVWR